MQLCIQQHESYTKKMISKQPNLNDGYIEIQNVNRKTYLSNHEKHKINNKNENFN
jgi:hypothetical protein